MADYYGYGAPKTATTKSLYPNGYDPNNLPALPSGYSPTTANAGSGPQAGTQFKEVSQFDPAINGAADTNSVAAGYSKVFDKLEPEAPDIDPRLKQIQAKQAQAAQQFRSNIPAMSARLLDPEVGQAKRDLAGAQRDIKANANQRGMLFSGLRAGAESNAAGKTASALAQRRSDINNQLLDQADLMDRGAIGTGLGMAGLNTGQANFDANNYALMQQLALQNMKFNQGAINDLSLGIGKLGGIGLSKLINSDDGEY